MKWKSLRRASGVRKSMPAFAVTVPLLVLFLSLVSKVGAANNATRVLKTPVTIQVQMAQPVLKAAQENYGGVAVWLVPINAVTTESDDPRQQTFRVVLHNKTFQPHLLVVPIGSIVEFANVDRWFHDAFSISADNAFHLGGFKGGGTRTVRFDRAGASHIFCGIHPDMAAVVLAVDSPYYGVSGRNGRVSFCGIPPGKYVLHVWYEKATPETLEALERVVTVSDGTCEVRVVSVIARQRVTFADHGTYHTPPGH
jgi:plastocyanin